MIPTKDGLDMVGLYFLVDMNSKKAYWSVVVIQTTPSLVRQAFYKNQPGKVAISGTQFEGPGHAGTYQEPTRIDMRHLEFSPILGFMVNNDE